MSVGTRPNGGPGPAPHNCNEHMKEVDGWGWDCTVCFPEMLNGVLPTHTRRKLRAVCAGVLDGLPWHYPGDMHPECPHCGCTTTRRGWRCIRQRNHWGSCAAVPTFWNLKWRWKMRGMS